MSTIFPLPNSSQFEESEPSAFVPTLLPRTRRLLEKKPKEIIKEAQGTLNPRRSRPKKVVKPKLGKNLAKETGKGKRGPFGEKYSPPPGNTGKGLRVSESSKYRLYDEG